MSHVTPLKPTRLIKPKQVTIEYGIAYSTIRDAGLRGELPVVHLGRAWYLERADVERWIESRKETAAA